MRLGLSLRHGDLPLSGRFEAGSLPELDLDFRRDRYRAQSAVPYSGSLNAAGAFTRAGNALAPDKTGGLHAFAANQPRQTDAGLRYQGEGANHAPYGANLETGWSFLSGGTGTMPALPAAATLASTTPAPDGRNSDAGKGVTCTGLALDGLRGLLVLGNDGRNREADGNGLQLPSLVLINAATLIKTGELSIAFPVGTHGLQGVAHDSVLDLYAVCVPSLAAIHFFDPDNGDHAGSLALPPAITQPNGLAFDTLRDCFWVLDVGTFDIHRIGRDGALLGTHRTEAGTVQREGLDHLHYDAANDLILFTSGNNGGTGYVWALDPTLDRVTKACAMAEAKAIEGVAVRGTELLIANDGYYHGVGSPPENALLHYPLSALAAWRRHRVVADYAELPQLGTIADRVILDKGAGLTSGDFDLLTNTGVAFGSTSAKVLSLWARTTHGDAVTIALRCDTAIANITVGPEWQRHFVTGTVVSAPTIQFGLRQGGAPYTTSPFADICVALVQLETGSAPGEPIANETSGAATRAAEQLTVTLPEGVATARITFDDGAVQDFAGLPSSWSVPTALPTKCIHRITAPAP